MKKLFALTLAGIMCAVFMFGNTGCGDKKPATPPAAEKDKDKDKDTKK